MIQPSYSQGPFHPPLLDLTIGQALARTVARDPEGLALVDRQQQVRYTWRQLAEAVQACARGWLALGLEPGDRVGVWSPNCAQWCIAQLACAECGLILVSLNPAYRSAELGYALQQSGCRWLIVGERYKTSDFGALAAELLPSLASSTPGALSDPEYPQLRGVIALGAEPSPGMLPWTDLLAAGASVPLGSLAARRSGLRPEQAINIQYTSGTTGRPKGVTLSHRNVLNNGYLVGASLGLTPNDRVVVPVPLFHCFGMVMSNLACVVHGSTLIYPGPGFDPEAVLRAVAEERATVLHGVPTMFIGLLDHPLRRDLDLSSLRTGIMAGTTCPAEVMRQVIEQLHMGQVQICYGMTETSPVSAQTAADDDLDHRVTTVGRTHPHLEQRIVDSAGQTVPRGEVGELCTRGYSVMLGYWNDPAATAEVLDADGWMRTGDLATLDAEGYLRIVGRNKDMIIRGGENIYPREVEEFLHGHPDVAQAQVVGVPDARYGEVVVAWVTLHPGHLIEPDALRDWCAGRIAHYKVPCRIRVVEGFPMTLSGKVQKFRMREIEQGQP